MISQRNALMGGALGHLTIPGITLALIYGFDVSLGALAFLIVGVTLIWLFEKRTKLPKEALTAVVFASSLAIAFLYLPKEEREIALIGNISRISGEATLIVLLSSLVIFFITKKIFSESVLMNISKDLAKAEGINVPKTNLIYLISIALSIALGVRIVGGLLTAALVAIPACTSKNISRNLKQYSYGAMLIGAISALIGILVFSVTGINAGLAIIIVNSIFFLISLLFVKK